MSSLWVPYGVRRQRATRTPTGDVRLKSGRFLKRLADFPDPDLLAKAEALGVHEDPEGYVENGLRLIVSVDRTHHGELLHASISYADHEPTWRDVRDVRDTLFPDDVDVMMVLPQAKDYVNVHPFAFHLWQTPTEWGIR
jgi:hypothetical protein